MARKIKLTKEQVWVIQQNVGDKKLKEYAQEFGVSYATVYHAKKGIGSYTPEKFNFDRQFELVMLNKYFPVVEANAA